MTKVIAIANQKGGVGKTSTTVNLGAGLVRQGYAVLAIDFDPQANLTMALGFKSPDDMEYTVSNVLAKAMEVHTHDGEQRQRKERLRVQPQESRGDSIRSSDSGGDRA